MITYFIISLAVYAMWFSIDNFSGRDAFMSEKDKMRRIALCLIWPLTLIILYITFRSGRNK
jgi:hypothetical protein